jgi:alkylation response protein AidB-like acyl-CoA dehydrogenase
VDFAFSPEQEDLRHMVRQFLDKASPETEVRRVMATERGHDPDIWRRMAAELGLVGIAIPERYGGAGAGVTELGLVMQEMGRALLCAPYLATAVLAVSALLAAADEAAQARWLPPIAAGDLIGTVALPERLPTDPGGITAQRGGRHWTMHGTARFVPDGHVADLILVPATVPAGPSLFAVPGDAAGLGRRALPTFDPTRKFAELQFSATPATLIGPAGAAGPILGRIFDLACVLLACEQVGVAECALDMARDYALLRTQFGRPIGSFQAVKHKLASVLLEVEAARSAAWFGLWAADSNPAELPAVASIAQATCSAAAYLAATENIQVHGGIGYTWEHPAQLYFRRATTARMWLGDPAGHYERLYGQLRSETR